MKVKLNNKGFAISTIMYIILVFALLLVIATMTILSSRKLILDKVKKEVKEQLEISYKELEYIESTGTQYIDTGVVPDNNTGYDVEFSQNHYNVNDISGCGIGTPANATARFYLFYLYNSSNLGYGFGNYYTKVIALKTNQKYKGQMNYLNDRKVIFNGEELQTNLSEYVSCNRTILLFARNMDDILKYSGYRLYNLKITNNSNIIRDFIPVLDKDGVPCLYDKVEQKYYYNQGTGEFLYE